MTTPPPIIVPPIHSRGLYRANLAKLDVVHHAEWQPHDGITYCNFASKAGCDANCVPLPQMLANDQQVWLAGPPGLAAGWVECSAQRAGEQGEKGIPTLSTLHEPGHGHITHVVGVDEHGGLLIWQAGRQNFELAPIRAAYTVEQLEHVRYFTRSA